MARDPGETNSFITVDHDVLCYWLTVTPSPPHYHRSRSEYLINPSLSNNSIIVNFSISAGKLEQKHEDEGQGDLYCRKIVVSTHWKVGMEWKGEGSVLVHSNIIFFLIFPFHSVDWEFLSPGSPGCDLSRKMMKNHQVMVASPGEFNRGKTMLG